MSCANENQIELLKVLESNGIDVKPKRRKNLFMGLRCVAHQGNLEMLKLLVKGNTDMFHYEFNCTLFSHLRSFEDKCHIFDWFCIEDKLKTLEWLKKNEPKTFRKITKTLLSMSDSQCK